LFTANGGVFQEFTIGVDNVVAIEAIVEGASIDKVVVITYTDRKRVFAGFCYDLTLARTTGNK